MQEKELKEEFEKDFSQMLQDLEVADAVINRDGIIFEWTQNWWLSKIKEHFISKEEVMEWLRYAIHNAKGKTADQELARLLRDLKKDDLLSSLSDNKEVK